MTTQTIRRTATRRRSTEGSRRTKRIILTIIAAAAIFGGLAAHEAVPASAAAGGPVVLMGIDAEDGGPGGHGPIGTYANVVNSIQSDVTNGGSNILVIGCGKLATDNVTTFWNAIAPLTSPLQAVTCVNGAAAIAAQSFAGYAIIAVASDVVETPSGGLTNAENDALTLRALDISTHVNNGGGLLGFSSARLTTPYGYLGSIGAFTFAPPTSYSLITPTPAGLLVGVTDTLDVCCWHDEYITFPSFLNVLATNDATTNAAAIGGQNVIIAPGPGGTVPTNATVANGTGVAPNIECKWELPDMQSTLVHNGIQYETVPAALSHAHDDDPAAFPSVNPACTNTPTTNPSMPNNVHNMIQVKPNAEDDPEERWVQLWGAVDHPNGLTNITAVYWKVYHPDGSFKVQAHADPSITPNSGKLSVADCNGTGLTNLGTSTGPDGSMWEAAVHTGQISAAAVDGGITPQSNTLRGQCAQGLKAIYFSEFSISKHQPCGEYKIEMHALSLGAEATFTNYIDVICFYDLALDFSTVNWGAITPGVTDVVGGDTNFNPPNSLLPTVKNRGNHGMGIGLNYSPMVEQPPVGGSKQITVFDGCFGHDFLTLQCIDPMNAGTQYDFSSLAAQVLCSNEVGKLDFSIHPQLALPAATYLGSVSVIARAVHGICSTDQEVHGP